MAARRLFLRIRLASAQRDAFLLTAIFNGHLVQVCSSHVHVLSSFYIYLQCFGGRGSTSQCRYNLGSKPSHIAVEHSLHPQSSQENWLKKRFPRHQMLLQPSHAELVVFFWRACFHPSAMGRHRERDGRSKLQLCPMSSVLLFRNEVSLIHDRHESSLHILMFVSSPLLDSLQERGAKNC